MSRKRPDEKPAGELVPQPHGGAIKRGNPKGIDLPGRPPSELRARMRGSLEERLHIAAAIADDKDATNADRLKALDFLARYGLGTKQEVTGEDGAPVHAGVVILPALRNG